MPGDDIDFAAADLINKELEEHIDCALGRNEPSMRSGFESALQSSPLTTAEEAAAAKSTVR